MATKTLLTLEEFERLPDDETLYELSEGELITLVYPKLRHSRIAHRVFQKITEARADGEVLIEALYVLSEEPPTLRRPDVSFLSAERVAQTPEDDWVRGSPELAVEIVSPSQSAQDLDEKTHQYLRAGALAVWVVYPKTRTVHVHTPGRDPVVKDENGVLALPELFPNWSLKVSHIF